ncbi:hypothetical protein EYZ11_000232 [Aspergillus tanneri]|uniref:Uncharacterized protein n=1 Tax=Aspergillus tanneri TaxID=1220188 RepID=A0A4S3JXS1_9EURO|nr:hypothetical protein EYZ11_000232 [Aspergillus tanneri]
MNAGKAIDVATKWYKANAPHGRGLVNVDRIIQVSFQGDKVTTKIIWKKGDPEYPKLPRGQIAYSVKLGR